MSKIIFKKLSVHEKKDARAGKTIPRPHHVEIDDSNAINSQNHRPVDIGICCPINS
ncbi:MAG: hypothetical protein GY757_20945 [bacterium]|nr:hypothetical protein [bacterium]